MKAFRVSRLLLSPHVRLSLASMVFGTGRIDLGQGGGVSYCKDAQTP
jgi:hypothetical protein